MLTSATIEVIDRYWSSFFGCPRQTLYGRGTVVLAHVGLADYRGIFAFLRGESLLVSIPADLLDAVGPRVQRWLPGDLLDEDRLRHDIGYPVERIVGPAFIGYTDATVFEPASRVGVRALGRQDVPALAALRAVCTPLEWEHGGSQLEDRPVMGVYAEGRLVTVAGYQLWDVVIAHISVITHPQHRGRGYGRAAVSRLTEEVLAGGLVPQYRTLEANRSSVAIARVLGFEHYATSVAARLSSHAT